MADSAISSVVRTLGDFLIQPVGRRLSFRNDVEWLKREFQYMQSFLHDAERKQSGDPRVQQLVSEITGLARETVHILEEFNIKVGNDESREHGIVDRVKRYARTPKREARIYAIGNKIKSVKERVMDLSRRRETYGITSLSNAGERPSNNGSSLRELRRSTPYAEGELLVGFEDVKKMLLTELLKDEARRSVISIYGMGGSGKTTLARELYKSVDKSIAGFDCRAWVCVSQDYSTKDLLQTIIKSFKKVSSGEELEMLERMNEVDLEAYLRNFLEDKKYIVVVDDVWHQKAWQSLQRAFPDCSNGSRVIITTRNKEVAERVDDKTFAHRLRNLSPAESWNLFKKKISLGGLFSPAMQETGKEMVEKCRGLPLAIIVLGGLLSNKKELDEWLSVKEQLWRHMKDDSIEISHLFSLSYSDLSAELKDCFLYVGIFPEDYEFSSEKLMRLWMAEGFIQGNNMEYDAWRCLRDLIGRCLIQVAEESWRGIEACRIHDLLRDLVVAEAMKSNLFDIYDSRVYKGTPSGNRLRLAIHSPGNQSFLDGQSPAELKSLVFFNLEFIDKKKLKTISKKFKQLSVLYQEKSSYSDNNCGLPPNIKNLNRLKFLTLKDINSLPRTIGKLKNLQTLELRPSLGHCKFPMEISQLIDLRHLYLFIYNGNFRLDSLTNLRTLKEVTYEHWMNNDTANLVNLQELGLCNIWPLGSMAYSLDSVRNLINLTTLSLKSPVTLPPLHPLFSCPRLSKLSLEGRIEKLPPSDELPQCLQALKLRKTQLSKDPMPILEKLLNLRSLYLDEAFLFVSNITCSNGGFHQLEHLTLSNLPLLKKWELAEEALPVIRSFTIIHCPELTIPERLGPIASGQ